MSKLDNSINWLSIKQISEFQKCSSKTVRRKLSNLMSKLDTEMSKQTPKLYKRENNKILVNEIVVNCDFNFEQLEKLLKTKNRTQKEPIIQDVELINNLKAKNAILSNEKKYLVDKVSYLEKDCQELKKELSEVNQERRKEAEQFRILLMKDKELQIQVPQINPKNNANVDLYGILLVLFVVGMLFILGFLALIGW